MSCTHMLDASKLKKTRKPASRSFNQKSAHNSSFRSPRPGVPETASCELICCSSTLPPSRAYLYDLARQPTDEYPRVEIADQILEASCKRSRMLSVESAFHVNMIPPNVVKGQGGRWSGHNRLASFRTEACCLLSLEWHCWSADSAGCRFHNRVTGMMTLHRGSTVESYSRVHERLGMCC